MARHPASRGHGKSRSARPSPTAICTVLMLVPTGRIPFVLHSKISVCIPCYSWSFVILSGGFLVSFCLFIYFFKSGGRLLCLVYCLSFFFFFHPLSSFLPCPSGDLYESKDSSPLWYNHIAHSYPFTW